VYSTQQLCDVIAIIIGLLNFSQCTCYLYNIKAKGKFLAKIMKKLPYLFTFLIAVTVNESSSLQISYLKDNCVKFR